MHILLKKGRFYFCTILAFLTALQAKSSHMAGAELSYRYEGNDRYNVSYTLYVDCSGSIPPTSINLVVKSTNCNISSYFPLPFLPGSEFEIGTNCTSSPSTCNGGSMIGYKQLQYSASILLTEKCSDYIFSVTDCCRNSAITSIINPESQPLYVEAFLDNTLAPNSSPVFDSSPILLLSLNQLNQLSESAIDQDDDSLVYELIAPKTSEITNVNYTSTHSCDQFVNSLEAIQFNTTNGMLTLIPNSIETAVLAVKVSEYRNGTKIGSAMRDIQLITTNSNNHLPSIQQLDQLVTPLYKLCVGDDLLIDLNSFDQDLGQSTTITVTSNISDLSITKSVEQNQKAKIQWKADHARSNNDNLWIKIEVRDNACPMNGLRSYFLNLFVSNLDVTASVTNSDCKGKNNGSILLEVLGDQAPDFTWSHSTSNLPYSTGLSAGVYTVKIDDHHGCIVNRTFQINNLETIAVESSTKKASCNNSDGNALIVASGGIMPYQYIWEDGIDLSERTELKKGIYSVEVVDQIGCKISSTVIVESENCVPTDKQFQLYPNPTTNQIIIQNDFLNSAITAIMISDASGKLVYSNVKEISDQLMTTIDVSNFSTGIYFVKIVSGNEIIVLPFAKQ